MIYFDTSYLVRLYIEDPGWEAVRALAEGNEIASSLHGRAETTAAIHRVFREKRVDAARFRHVLRQFQADCHLDGFRWLPLDGAVISRIEQAYQTLPQDQFLRAADALHLACAAENGFAEIYSNDARLLAAAPHFGIKGVNIIP